MGFLSTGKITPIPIERQGLYRVTVEHTVYVAAINRQEAEQLAKDFVERDRPDPEVFAGEELKELKYIEKDWLEGYLPGLETDETLVQFFERIKLENPEVYDHPDQKKIEFPYDERDQT